MSRVFLLVAAGHLALTASPTVAADDGGVDIVVGVQYGTPPQGQDGRDASRCVWLPAGAASTTDSASADVRVVDGVTQHLYFRSCPAAVDLVWIADRSPAQLAAVVTDEARARVPAPAFGSAPAAGTGIVNADMWLWTDDASFAPVSTGTAWVPTPNGSIWAQATATPLRIVLDPGEPGASPAVCDGPGAVWDPSLGDEAASSCMYRYHHSSAIAPDGVFHARWSIVWSLTTSGTAGTTVEQFVTTSSHDITVREIQALVVG